MSAGGKLPPEAIKALTNGHVAAPLHAPEKAMIGIARDFADVFSSYLESPLAFFYFAFLAYFGSLVAKKITLDSELRPEPRLYVVLIGESADTRKSTALRKTRMFFQGLGSPHVSHELFGVGSAEGLAAELKEQSDLLLVQDELKAFVDKAKREGSVTLPMVTTLFEDSDYDNRVKAERISVRGASLSLLAACTADTYATMFDQRFFAIGFLNRLWLVNARSTARISIPRMIPDKELAELRTAVRERLDAIDRDYVQAGMRPVAYSMTARARSLFDAWYAERTGGVFERRLDTYGHRLMVLLAATADKAEVDEEVAHAAVDLLKYQLNIRRELDPVDAENTIAMLEEKIRRLLSRGPLKSRELKRRASYQRYGLWAWNTAIDNLLTASELTVDTTLDTYSLNPTVSSVVSTVKNEVLVNDDANYFPVQKWAPRSARHLR